MKTGAELITEERQRQVSQEGWTPEHDDKHNGFQMTDAAICYAEHVAWCRANKARPHGRWPWFKKWWKPSKDPVRNLVKAGALIAAEIDRLQRAEKKGGSNG